MCCDSVEESINQKIKHASHYMTEKNQVHHDCHDEENKDDDNEGHECHSACCTTFSVIEFKISHFDSNIIEYKIDLPRDAKKSPKNIITELFRPPALA